jgi:hypothetical protein
MKETLSVGVDSEKLEKLRRVAKQKRKTMTQLIEDWSHRLQEEMSPAYGRGFKPSFSVKLLHNSKFALTSLFLACVQGTGECSRIVTR